MRIVQNQGGRLRAYSGRSLAPARIDSAESARREALARKRDQGGLNYDETMEFGYSPSTFAIGCRHATDAPFLVFNVYYPMYGRSDEVTDWISVGVARPKR